MNENCSRRGFLLSLLGCAALSECPVLSSWVSESITTARYFSTVPILAYAWPSFAECDNRLGRGVVLCSACEGTTRWTEISESAGQYQREAVRLSERCPFCNEWGEAVCTTCDAAAYTPKLPFDSR